MKCKCGREIEITVPMFTDGKDKFICKDCFENKKEINGFIATAKDYIEKFQKVIERNQKKRKINDQLDLLIDDFTELLGELRSTKKPLPKERKDYFLEKLEIRREKISELKKMDKEESKIIAEKYSKKPVAEIFPENVEKIKNAICVVCRKEIEGFRNAICKKEYGISGLCQNCQDKVFESMTKCLNCGKEITKGAEVCSVECSEEYFKYVFGEALKDHPEFKTKIDGEKDGNI